MRIVLLHAFPCDGSLWSDVAEILRTEGHEVECPDLRGFGSAPLGDAVPDLGVMADDVIALLGDRDEPIVVAGVSMGGYVAMDIAARRPGLLAGLGLVDTKASADAEQARERREGIAVLAESGGAWQAGMIEGLLGPTTRAERPGVVERVEGFLARADARSVAWAQRAMANRQESFATLRALDIPVTVVWGAEDVMSPAEEQEAMLEAVVDGQGMRIDGVGHLSPVENPKAVAVALAQLAERVSDR